MAVQGPVTESQLLSWVYDLVDVRTFARILGIAEIVAGLAIALRPVVRLLSVLGGAFVVVLFAVTLTFLLTTPLVYESAGFPHLSPMPGQFLAKDLLLLATAGGVRIGGYCSSCHAENLPSPEMIAIVRRAERREVLMGRRSQSATARVHSRQPGHYDGVESLRSKGRPRV